MVAALMRLPMVGDPVMTIDRFTEYIPLSLLGPGFDYQKYTDEYSSSVYIEYERCFFKDFFAKEERNFLAKVACSWYHTWGRNVDVDRHGFRLSRLSCMCEGDTRCTFEFKRMSRLEDTEMSPA